MPSSLWTSFRRNAQLFVNVLSSKCPALCKRPFVEMPSSLWTSFGQNAQLFVNVLWSKCPALCERSFVETPRHLIWITCCLLTWVRTRIPSDMTHEAHNVPNSVLISRTSFLTDTSFLTTRGPPQESEFRLTGVALSLAADFLWILPAEQWQPQCYSTFYAVPPVPNSELQTYEICL